MEESLEISPISNTSNCSKCLFFIENPESNHTSCRYHRICFNKDGYNPEACDICCVNRDNWFDNSNDEAIGEWKKSLVAHQKNSKGFSFIYGFAFNNHQEEIQRDFQDLNLHLLEDLDHLQDHWQWIDLLDPELLFVPDHLLEM